jgi:DNA helicase II / ATP-dependent DNA helicase PcrA
MKKGCRLTATFFLYLCEENDLNFEEFKKQFAIELNSSQEKAVQTGDGASLILAVPGSGKTTVIITRIAYLIYVKKIEPKKILTITYTVSATREMKERFHKNFGFSGIKGETCPEFRTINGISQKILHYFGSLTGKKPYELIGKDSITIIKQVFLNITGNYATEYDLKTIQTGITYVKNMGFTNSEIEELEMEQEHFYEIYQEYQKELKLRRRMDYDDQMVYALQILKLYPDVLENFQNHYSYLCVDEAQDTSKIQHDIIHLLSVKGQQLFMVGDEDQSIYGFRAAYPKVLYEFESIYPGSKIFLMEENYRSNWELVQRADGFIQGNKNRHPKRMTAATTISGHVKNIKVKSRKEQYEVLSLVASDCLEKTAVLFRNHESALPLIDLLERKNIPYQMKGNEATFFSHPMIQDLMDFILFAQNPMDSECFMRIYYKMGVGINKQLAGSVTSFSNNGKRILERVAEHGDASVFTKKQCNIQLQHFRELAKEEPAKAIRRIRHHMGYQDYVNRSGMDERKMETFELLALQEKTLDDFLTRIEEMKEILVKDTSGTDSKFILSTIHASKGLEYSNVYLLDMLQGVLPSIDCSSLSNRTSKEDLALFEEERRIYYVAVTRAMQNLSIFTFSNQDTSDFTKELFRVPVKRDLPDEALFRIGTEVFHQKFGNGVVLKREEEILEIEFLSIGLVKKIALQYVLEHDILRVEISDS